MSKNKFISQQERMANLHPNLKEKIEELNKESYHEEEYQYYLENDDRPLIDWEEYEKTLDKANLTELIIKPNEFNFIGNKLVLKDYPKLKTLYACGLGLKEAELDCPVLLNLYLTNNVLAEMDLTNTPNLKNLLINDNALGELEIKHLKYLEDLRCNNNFLNSLDIRDLEHLETLDCSRNVFLPFFGGLELGNNPALRCLDAAENNLNKADFNFPYLPNLEMLSLRHDSCSEIENLSLTSENFSIIAVDKVDLILSSPKLKFLDYHRSCFKSAVFHKDYPLENPTKLQVCNAESYRDSDGSYNPDVPTDWEDCFNRMKQQRENEWLRGDWGFAFDDNPNKFKKSPKETTRKEKTSSTHKEVSITDPLLLTSDYPEPHNKNEIEELTITHLGLAGTIVFDGWQKLRKLNIGNNYLSYLVVRNCPRLEYLRYAHNKMRHDAFIDNLPNLIEISKENYNGGIVWDRRGEKQFEKGELKGKDNLNEHYIQNHSQKPAQDARQNEELKTTSGVTEQQELTEEQTNEEEIDKEQTEEQKILAKITEVVSKAEQALKNNDLKEVARILEQIKQYANNEVYKNNKDLIESVSNLEQALFKKQSEQYSTSHKQTFPYWLIVVIYGIFLLFWIWLYLKIKTEDKL